MYSEHRPAHSPSNIGAAADLRLLPMRSAQNHAGFVSTAVFTYRTLAHQHCAFPIFDGPHPLGCLRIIQRVLLRV